MLGQSINQSINTFITRHSTEARATVQIMLKETKRNVLSRVLNVSTDGAGRQSLQKRTHVQLRPNVLFLQAGAAKFAVVPVVNR